LILRSKGALSGVELSGQNDKGRVAVMARRINCVDAVVGMQMHALADGGVGAAGRDRRRTGEAGIPKIFQHFPKHQMVNIYI
jgi:hypothetical protein